MKKAATLDQDQDIEVSGGRLSKACLPTYTYTEALDLVVKLPSGAIRAIRACSVDELYDLVEAVLPTARDPKRCKQAIGDIDFDSMLDRWYLLLELAGHGCTLPIVREDA